MSAGVAVLLVLFSVLGFGLAQLQYGWPDQLFTIGNFFTRATNAVVGNEKPPAPSAPEGTSARAIDPPVDATATQAQAGTTQEVPKAPEDESPPAPSAPTRPEEITRRPAAPPSVANAQPRRLAEGSEKQRPILESPSRPVSGYPSSTLGRPGTTNPVGTSAIERVGNIDGPAATAPSAEPAPTAAVIPAVATAESSVVSIPTAALDRRADSRHAESELIRSVLVRYETAYNRLDAKAAGSIWPRVDQAALGRAFDGLITQRVSLGLCEITVIGNIGGASCAGKAKWEPKIGGGIQTADRYWSFNLRKTDDGWKIEEARVR